MRSFQSRRETDPVRLGPPIRGTFVTPPSKPAGGDKTCHYLAVTAAITAMIMYGSLFPFDFSGPGDPKGPLVHLVRTWRDWDQRGDLLSNILLYMPFGFFATLSIGRCVPRLVRPLLAILAGTLLSCGMEMLQVSDAGRVSSMGDVYANAIGSAVGATAAWWAGNSIAWPLVGALAVNPDATLLLAAFLGYRLYPYVPTIDLHKYWHAVQPLLYWHSFGPVALFRQATGWLLVASLVTALYGFRAALPLLPCFMAFVYAARILIIDLALQPVDLAGATLSLLVCAVWLGRSRERHPIVAAVVATMIVIDRLEPFHFAGPQHAFGWVPFWSLLHGSINVAVQAFFSKTFQYGGLIWLLTRAGLPQAVATLGTATLLLVTSYAETWLPGRSGEITDPVLALMLGLLMPILGARRC